jgi:NAD-dependent deacetylase
MGKRPFNDTELNSLAQELADLIINSERIVVFTGTGISTESGIPDFRGPGGVWERFDPDDFAYQKFLTDPEARRKHWQMLHGSGLTTEAEPNQTHYAIAELDRLGKLDCVITQNMDNLHQKAGLPNGRVLELHGNMQWAVCLSCGKRYPFEQVKTRLDVSETVPDCEACHGLLKPGVVFFGESLPDGVLEEAARRSQNCDLLLVIGSTLVVYPAAYIPVYAVESGASLVIINLSPTPMDKQATVVIRASAGETMSRMLKQMIDKIGS